jgi:hypothetical protein
MYKSIVALAFLFACGPKVTIENFDSPSWKNDFDGCQAERIDQVKTVVSQQELLLSKSESQLRSVFGAPDNTQLYTRNQKFYIYYTTPGPDCDVKGDSTTYLSIRFNAVGLSSEIIHFKVKKDAKPGGRDDE